MFHDYCTAQSTILARIPTYVEEAIHQELAISGDPHDFKNAIFRANFCDTIGPEIFTEILLQLSTKYEC